jgi:hypothetical protein
MHIKKYCPNNSLHPTAFYELKAANDFLLKERMLKRTRQYDGVLCALVNNNQVT